MENGATLYSSGRVLVLDGVTPPQEALVVRDGRVAGVGDAGDMTRLAGKGARCVSVRGATCSGSCGLAARDLDLSQCRSQLL